MHTSQEPRFFTSKQQTSNEVKILKEDLEKAKKERMHDINKKNEVIRKLKGLHLLVQMFDAAVVDKNVIRGAS